MKSGFRRAASSMARLPVAASPQISRPSWSNTARTFLRTLSLWSPSTPRAMTLMPPADSYKFLMCLRGECDTGHLVGNGTRAAFCRSKGDVMKLRVPHPLVLSLRRVDFKVRFFHASRVASPQPAGIRSKLFDPDLFDPNSGDRLVR